MSSSTIDTLINSMYTFPEDNKINYPPIDSQSVARKEFPFYYDEALRVLP